MARKCPKCSKFLSSTGFCTTCKENIPKSSSDDDDADADEEPSLSDVIKAINKVSHSLDAFKTKSKSQNAEIIKSLDSCHEGVIGNSELLESLNTQLIDATAKIEQLTTENHTLKRRIDELEIDNERQRQHTKRMTIEISGIDQKPQENLMDIALCVGKTLGVTIVQSDLEDVFRPRSNARDLGGNDATGKLPSPPIILTFNKLCIKKELISAKKNFGRPLTTRDLLWTDNAVSTIYLNEALTPYFRKVHATARAAKKSRILKYVWIRDGRIYGRKTDGSPALHFERIADIPKS